MSNTLLRQVIKSQTLSNPSFATKSVLKMHGPSVSRCFYSTQLPKKAAGAFTSNKHISKDTTSKSTIASDDQSNDNILNKTLVYIGKWERGRVSTYYWFTDDLICPWSYTNVGPFSETIKRYKMTASLFGMCGICAVPALLSTGQAPALSVALGKVKSGGGGWRDIRADPFL